MADKRTIRTTEAIKDAMLQLLQEKPLTDIGMADLARCAGVSRSTLYSHFGNTRDVFISLVESFTEDVRGLHTQLKCGTCKDAPEKRPFCMAVRAAGKYQPLVLAPEFLAAYLDCLLNGSNLVDVLEPYLSTGISEKQARALFIFQMTGCYTAATTMDSMLWEENQQAIDQFIRGGMNALRSMPHR